MGTKRIYEKKIINNWKSEEEYADLQRTETTHGEIQ